jgi:microsomal dipeptidase-like Zn-dependent dipeptidase
MANLSRRQFLRSTLLSGAGILSSSALGSWFGCAANCVTRAAPPRHGRRVLADLHAHAMLNEWNARSPLPVKIPALAKIAKTFFNSTKMSWESCHRAGIDLLCVTHFNVFDEWLSMPTDPNPEAPANTILMMNLLEEALAGPAAPYARLARNYGELKKLLEVHPSDSKFRTAVVHTLEGGHALGGSLAPLKKFARRGVALITITHFFNKGIATAPNSYPYFPDNNSRWPAQGLSDFGRDVIKEMEALGIIVDVTHTTSTALAEVLRESHKPLVATHSSARTLGDHPYSFYDEPIQEISRRGGMIGVILYPYVLSNYSGEQAAKKSGSLDDVVRTIRYIAKICGTHKCIGIGSDFSGFITGPKEMNCLSEIDKLRQLLLQEFGRDEQIVEDIMANNVIGLLQNHWRSGN